MVEFFLHLVTNRGTQSQLALPALILSIRIGLRISIDCYQQLEIALIMQIPVTSAFDQERQLRLVWVQDTAELLSRSFI
jgi:hypothetical protein